MTIDAKGLATARRNLAQRVARLLSRIEREDREATAWEAHYTSIALDQLELDHTGDGEWTMLHAEREDAFNPPASPKPLPGDARKATVTELRARLTTLEEA